MHVFGSRQQHIIDVQRQKQSILKDIVALMIIVKFAILFMFKLFSIFHGSMLLRKVRSHEKEGTLLCTDTSTWLHEYATRPSSSWAGNSQIALNIPNVGHILVHSSQSCVNWVLHWCHLHLNGGGQTWNHVALKHVSKPIQYRDGQ